MDENVQKRISELECERDKLLSKETDSDIIRKINKKYTLRIAMLKKYGVESALQLDKSNEKKKATCIEKYGVDNPSKSKEITIKRESTNLQRYGAKNGRGYGSSYHKSKMKEKYGCESSLKNPDIREKRLNTIKERYLVDNPNKNASLRRKWKASIIMHYGVDNPSKSPIIREKKRINRLHKNR